MIGLTGFGVQVRCHRLVGLWTLTLTFWMVLSWLLCWLPMCHFL